jgi:signal transduction histidine kinase
MTTTMPPTPGLGRPSVRQPPRPLPRPPLRRARASAISGVSAGLAIHLGWPVTLVRALFALLTTVSGAGILLYLWLWATVPMAEGPPDAPREQALPTRRVPVAWLLTAATALAAVVVIGLFDAAAGRAASPNWFAAVAVVVVLGAAAGLWATFVDRADPARGPRHELAVRTTVTVVLGILWIVLLTTVQYGVGAFLAALLPLAGIAAVFASTLVSKWRELSQERIRRIREEQRSEMAAHLHDSVLQTLALIQNRAGASSEVARLARAQERELRSWLYDGDTPADSDLATDLRDYGAALELDYAVHIDVVATGASNERGSGDLAAAAREGMLNAARHAGGEVSVYIEGTATSVDVYIRDRGPGFDPDAVGADRLGVRESIVGRMRRAGGSGSVRSTAAGTEVRLHRDVPRGAA